MGLKEKRIIKAFQNDLYPALEAEINKAAGYVVPMDIKWDTLMEDRFSHIYHNTFPKIYFQPLIEAFKAICIDEMGVELLQAGLKKVIIVNENNEHSLGKAITFEEGVLKIDHSPVINADNVEDKANRIIELLENKLEEFAETSADKAPAAQAPAAATPAPQAPVTAAPVAESPAATGETQASEKQAPKFSMHELYNQSFALACEKQEIFSEIVEGLNWSCDMLEGKLTYGDDKVFDIQVIGTYSENEKSWLWAWANNQSGIPEAFLQTSLGMRDLGKAYDLEDLTSPKLQTDTDPGAYFSVIALGVFRDSCYVPLTFKGLKVYVTVRSAEVDDKSRTAPALICSHFTNLTASFQFPHKYCLFYYLMAKGYQVENSGNNILAKKGDDQILGIFDLKGNLMKISNSKTAVQA
ncbi:hypothetical protein SAMN05421766_102135 [Zobellia uliginosa]|uniref:Uncharacterized protein n=1 Tax=Zobellia uliginosa TaxID=143224 RepID=A0ABY1KLP7_9FLAO|nr:DUF6882 domain-containing protein [Zobellia uliginosa]SIS47480.1 hypothetical protein SAMN05421766_102135 [Zobellia uliginosa]